MTRMPYVRATCGRMLAYMTLCQNIVLALGALSEQGLGFTCKCHILIKLERVPVKAFDKIWMRLNFGVGFVILLLIQSESKSRVTKTGLHLLSHVGFF